MVWFVTRQGFTLCWSFLHSHRSQFINIPFSSFRWQSVEDLDAQYLVLRTKPNPTFKGYHKDSKPLSLSYSVRSGMVGSYLALYGTLVFRYSASVTDLVVADLNTADR